MMCDVARTRHACTRADAFGRKAGPRENCRSSFQCNPTRATPSHVLHESGSDENVNDQLMLIFMTHLLALQTKNEPKKPNEPFSTTSRE
jgi:hypothetical protein